MSSKRDILIVLISCVVLAAILKVNSFSLDYLGANNENINAFLKRHILFLAISWNILYPAVVGLIAAKYLENKSNYLWFLVVVPALSNLLLGLISGRAGEFIQEWNDHLGMYSLFLLLETLSILGAGLVGVIVFQNRSIKPI